ncbi:hypothetical protein SDC9_102133 [bioreactor metagenome]|uniref:Uncharacterized protein n=1 Tax=bioreactor metagenome TaxID=1076179 RepID=A0A645AQI1_9ZZZZ
MAAKGIVDESGLGKREKTPDSGSDSGPELQACPRPPNPNTKTHVPGGIFEAGNRNPVASG